MWQYEKILAAIDFSPASEKVGLRAVEVARHCGASLTFLHVIEFLPPLDFAWEPIATSDWITVEESKLQERAAQSLARFAQKVTMPEAGQRIALGTPKSEIIRVAREEGTHLIIVGSHGRHGVSRLLGATANGVLHNAPCDVLAVRIAP